MITAIFRLIFGIINFLISIILKLVMLVFPAFDLQTIYVAFSSFFDILKGSVNLTHFLLGSTAPFFINSFITLFGVKYLALPVINFVRKFILK